MPSQPPTMKQVQARKIEALEAELAEKKKALAGWQHTSDDNAISALTLWGALHTKLSVALRELAALREQVRWVPVSERLPQLDRDPKREIQMLQKPDSVYGRRVSVVSAESLVMDKDLPSRRGAHWREIGPLPGEGGADAERKS